MKQSRIYFTVNFVFTIKYQVTDGDKFLCRTCIEDYESPTFTGRHCWENISVFLINATKFFTFWYPTIAFIMILIYPISVDIHFLKPISLINLFIRNYQASRSRRVCYLLFCRIKTPSKTFLILVVELLTLIKSEIPCCIFGIDGSFFFRQNLCKSHLIYVFAVQYIFYF